ncbi:hypothetical protein GGI21_000749 [Coemansia aciculifera]|nr:hypothetical protein GGI21_000749 [Coemansia aciculifera]
MARHGHALAGNSLPCVSCKTAWQALASRAMLCSRSHAATAAADPVLRANVFILSSSSSFLARWLHNRHYLVGSGVVVSRRSAESFAGRPLLRLSLGKPPLPALFVLDYSSP